MAALAPCALAQQQPANQNRDKLVYESLERTRANSSFIDSAPITHVIPAFNTITYALLFENRDVTVTPKDDKNQGGNTQSLKLGGYTAAPYLAVSLRYFGLGFSAEDGRRTALYDETWSSGGDTQRSQVDYTALGAYLYLIPFPQANMAPTVILGAKNYNVRHVFGSSVSKDPGSYKGQDQTYRYSLTNYEFGLDVPIHLLKRFILIPWVDGNYVDTRQAASMSEAGDYQDDLQLFWHSDPRVRYGLDFAVKFFDRFEIHLGSAFGYVYRLGQSVPYYQDKSLSLSLSLDQKGS